MTPLAAAQVAETAEIIQRRWGPCPDVAIILGTGLGPLANEVRSEHTMAYSELPGFPQSSALSHRGILVCGRLSGATVAVMSGRCHLYEGYSAEQLAFPVRVLRKLGARLLIVSNAAGGVNPQFEAGDIMLMSDHINLMWQSPTRAARTASLDDYDPALRQHALEAARLGRFPLHQGVYVGVTGPNYETRSEYRLFRQIGGDAVGMSTVPEVLAAVNCGMRVLGLSLITNVARPDAPQEVDAHDVVKVASAGGANMLHIVETVLRK